MPKLKYTGAGWGGSIHAVPARDLTEEDIARVRYLGHTIRSLLASGFYVRFPKGTAKEEVEEEAGQKPEDKE